MKWYFDYVFRGSRRIFRYKTSEHQYFYAYIWEDRLCRHYNWHTKRCCPPRCSGCGCTETDLAFKALNK